jgi:molecular chaperone GrpE (heat shock protein)
MSLLTVPKTAKWPFFLGDALLIGLAWFIYAQALKPFDGATLAACVGCVTLGAFLGVLPFIIDYRAEIRLSESSGLAETVDQIRNLQTLASSVTHATGRWQEVHEQAGRAVDSARQVSDKMNEEMASFMAFLEKANDSERQHLRLEVDKLKRAESDWVGVVVMIMDHAHALRSAAIKAGQQRVVDQLNQFQAAIRDVARRVGLTPLEAEAGTVFDPATHQLPDGNKVTEGTRITGMLATGFSLRGQMIRPVIVEAETGHVVSTKTSPGQESPPAVSPETPADAPEQQLALGESGSEGIRD